MHVRRSRPAPGSRASRVVWAACAVAMASWTIGACDVGPAEDARKPETLWDLRRLCEEGGSALADAAPYAGPGPHPVIVFPPEEGYRHPSGGYTTAYPFATADADTVREPDPREVQLVACQQPAERRLPTDEPLATCAYDAIQGSEGWANALYVGRYRLALYEARTGRAVGEVLVVSTAPAPSTCDGLSYSADGAGNDSYSFPTPADYQAALRETVAGRRDRLRPRRRRHLVVDPRGNVGQRPDACHVRPPRRSTDGTHFAMLLQAEDD